MLGMKKYWLNKDEKENKVGVIVVKTKWFDNMMHGEKDHADQDE